MNQQIIPAEQKNPPPDIRISLASASPQRSAMLSGLGFPLLQRPQHIDESLVSDRIDEEALRLARLKAESCLSGKDHGRWILGVDTLVGIGSQILGKPADRDEARETLIALEGEIHTVWSGIVLLDTLGQRSAMKAVCTEVAFSSMSHEEIEWYLDSGEWDGAAGAYRIQERGALFIHALKGSYHNVVGLPIQTFYGMLRSFNYPFHMLKR
ncbi:Maf family protein [Marispirochaeta aestuarii]|nr:Maf family protein [Marispirochaeta aestuarii]